MDEEAGPASPGKVRLHIKIQNGEPQVVGYTNLNGKQPQVIPLNTLSSYDRDLLQALSVERLFQLAGSVFTNEAAVPAGYNVYYNIAFDPILGYFKDQKVAAYNWGFVSGKSQTIYPWDSWKKEYTAEPPTWSERDPHVPAPRVTSAVSECTTRTASNGTSNIPAAICAMAVSCP